MIDVLVAVSAYPNNNGKKSLYYVHSRNLYYIQNNINVDVLNFSATEDYTIDGITVYTKRNLIKKRKKYDLVICHAPNIRYHYQFLKEYGKHFDKILFIFHGHEVLHINRYYCSPYTYMKKEVIKRLLIQNIYDNYKLKIWKKFFLKNISKIHFIFVSNWFYQQFLNEMCFSKFELSKISSRTEIINNSVGSFFEYNNYSPEIKKYDFITIRNNMDGRTYSIDIITNLAKEFPQYRFCIIGKGHYFDHYSKSENITWIQKEMSHEEMKEYIDCSDYALLPTRQDTQGLMACELATYGIPLITSDIPVCREIFAGCKHVFLMNNEDPDLEVAVKSLKNNVDEKKWDKYFAKNTVGREICYIKLLSK